MHVAINEMSNGCCYWVLAFVQDFRDYKGYYYSVYYLFEHPGHSEPASLSFLLHKRQNRGPRPNEWQPRSHSGPPWAITFVFTAQSQLSGKKNPTHISYLNSILSPYTIPVLNTSETIITLHSGLCHILLVWGFFSWSVAVNIGKMPHPLVLSIWQRII